MHGVEDYRWIRPDGQEVHFSDRREMLVSVLSGESGQDDLPHLVIRCGPIHHWLRWWKSEIERSPKPRTKNENINVLVDGRSSVTGDDREGSMWEPFEEALERMPDQYKVIYGLLVTTSDALVTLTRRAYESAGRDLFEGPALFEVRTLLLNDILRMMDMRQHHQKVFEEFALFVYRAMEYDLCSRLLDNAELAPLVSKRAREYWDMDELGKEHTEAASSRARRLVLHLDASSADPCYVRFDHPVHVGGNIKDLILFPLIAQHYRRTCEILGSALGPVLDRTRDLRTVEVAELNHLMEDGIREGRKSRRSP